MGDPRPEKVAVVEEVSAKLAESDGALLTEYRGLDVPAMAALRRTLRESGGEYKIYKNTLVRLAAKEAGLDIEDLLSGPVAIAFVGEKADGSPGDAAGVAKALKDFAKDNDALILKGGVLDDKLLTVDEIKALADLPPRDVLLAQLAGAFQAPMAKMAGLLQALPQNFAYALQALIDDGGGSEAPAAAAEPSDADDTAEASAEAADDTAEASAEAADDTAEASAEAAEETAEATEAEASDDTDEAPAETAQEEEA
jgi:large subunit ribosomal protein L10